MSDVKGLIFDINENEIMSHIEDGTLSQFLKSWRNAQSIKLAKEQQEEPNIPLECVDGSCPIALSEEYEECGMDVVHSCAECPYQPQVQSIVRTQSDRIRNMSDEELARFIIVNVKDDVFPFCKSLDNCCEILDSGKTIPEEMCLQCCVKFLQSEVKEV